MAGRGSSHQGEDKVTSSSQEVLPHTFQLATHVTEEKPSTATPGSQTQKPHLGHRWEAGTCCKDVQPGACTLAPSQTSFLGTQDPHYSWPSGVSCTHPVKKEAPGQDGGIADAEGRCETQQAAAELQEAFIRELIQLQLAAQQLHLGETRTPGWL